MSCRHRRSEDATSSTSSRQPVASWTIDAQLAWIVADPEWLERECACQASSAGAAAARVQRLPSLAEMTPPEPHGQETLLVPHDRHE